MRSLPSLFFFHFLTQPILMIKSFTILKPTELQRPSLTPQRICLGSCPGDHLPWPIIKRLQQRRRTCSLFQCKDISNNDTARIKKTYDSLFGPPQYLQSLPLHQTIQKDCATHSKATETHSITRLSSTPVDIFLVKDFLSNPQDRKVVMEEAKNQGLEKALGSSTDADGDHGDNVRRSNSHVAWIAPNDDDDDNDDEKGEESQDIAGGIIATEMTQRAQSLFLPSSLLSQQAKQTSSSSFKAYTPENVQVVKYTPNGKFDLHHDGFSRHVTVLTYLNGVAGTWFPFAKLSEEEKKEEEWENLANEDWKSFWNMVERGTIVEELNLQPGVDGLLLLGKEKNASAADDDETSVDDDENAPKRNTNDENVVYVDAGDTVVFYNYDWYDVIDDDDEEEDEYDDDEEEEDEESIIPPLMNWRTMHAGLEVKEEKWIATNWFRNGFIPYRG